MHKHTMGKIEKCLYIVELLSRGKALSLREINEHWQYSSLYDGEIIPKTFGRYKEYISNVFAIDIEYDARNRSYYIANRDDVESNSLYRYLLSAFHVQGLSELALKHKDKVVLDEAPSGVEQVHTILEAIDRGQLVEFDYYSYTKKEQTYHRLIPCFVKTWEQRWYLVAEPLTRKTPTVYALERITNLRLVAEEHRPTEGITAQSYFDACFGVNHTPTEPQLIKLKVYGSQVDYVRARPIHSSQEEVETHDDYSIFNYWVRPCYNLYQTLLWHRERIEVLGPECVREEMKAIVKKMMGWYE